MLFAAAGLPDAGECLPLADGEAHVVDRVDDCALAREHALLHGEVFDESLRLDERAAHDALPVAAGAAARCSRMARAPSFPAVPAYFQQRTL